jgi:hypothetical protein
MKRNVWIFGLAALCGIAMAAPYTYAAGPCGTMAGKTYAVSITGGEYFNGTEPGTAQPVPNPIACVGVLEITTGVTTCTVGGELVCNDNDVVSGPGTCDTSVLPPGVAYAPPLGITAPTVVSYSGIMPGLSGTAGDVTGTAVLNSASIGSLSITSASTGVSATFTIADGLGSGTFVGHSNADDTQSTTPPILAIVGGKQGTVLNAQPFPTAYGTAPYLGETTTLFTGPGDNANGGSQVYPGGFGISAGLNQTNPDGTGGGFTSFNNNNNWAGAPFNTPFPNDVCYDNVSLCSGPYSDGTVNVAATFFQPYTGQCTDANLAGGFTLASALYGAKLNYQYVLVTGDTAGVLAGGAYTSDPGLVALGNITPTLFGKRHNPAKIIIPKAETLAIGFYNTSGEDCQVALALTGSPAAVCQLYEGTSGAGSPCLNDGGAAPATSINGDVCPGYTTVTAKTDPGAVFVACSAKPADSLGTITVSSTNCAELNGSIAISN